MLFDDDAPSTSSADFLQSPHEAKRKELMRKLEKKGMRDAATKPGADLNDLRRALLKGQMDKKNDKSMTPIEDKKPGKTATKTREQEIASEMLTADAKPTAEQLAKQGMQDEKAEQNLKDDEAQSEDA